MVETLTEAELRAKIVSVDTRIEEALGISEYEVDTGADRQRVKKQSIAALQKYRASLEARLEALLYGNVSYVSPRY